MEEPRSVCGTPAGFSGSARAVGCTPIGMDATNYPELETLLEEKDWLRSLIRGLVRDPNAAADLEQDTWLAALNAPPSHLEGRRAWLRVVAHRLALRDYRTSRSRRAREEEVSRGEALPATAKAVAHAESIKFLVEATLALDEPFREVVLLRYFERLTPSAIAERLGVPAATVRSRLTRALAKLRRELRGKVEAQDLAGVSWAGAVGDRLSRWFETLGGFQLGAAVGVLLLLCASTLIVIGRGSRAEDPGGRNAREGQALPVFKQNRSTIGGRGEADAVAEAGGQGASLLALQPSAQQARQGAGRVPVARETLTCGGTIRAPDGSPIKDALLVIRAPRSGLSQARPKLRTADDPNTRASTLEVLTLRSDEFGSFEVPKRFLVPKQRFQNDAYSIAYQPGPSDRLMPASQVLLTGLPIALRPDWRVDFAGVARDAESGLPIKGVQVLYGLGGMMRTTDDQGRFRFAGIAHRQNVLARLHHPDYAPSHRRILLIGREPAPQEFVLDRGLSLRLFFVDDETGQAAGEGSVSLGHLGLAPLVCDRDGGVTVRVADHGRQVLHGQCPGFANFQWSFRAEEVDPHQALRIPMSRLRIANGVVVDRDGATVRQARVVGRPVTPTVGREVPGLPGTLWRTLIGVGEGQRDLNRAEVAPDGTFALAFVSSDGPWNVSASASGARVSSASIESLGDPLRLVLESERADSEEAIVVGRLLRDGRGWGQEEQLTLMGASEDSCFVNPDGRFRLSARSTGQYQLSYHGSRLHRFQVHPGEQALDLGEIDLGHLPSLSLRFENAQGEPLVGSHVLLRPMSATAPTASEGLDSGVPALWSQTDSAGRIDLLVPRPGRYVATVFSGSHRDDGAPLCRTRIDVPGDSGRVICVPNQRTLFVHWIHSETGRPIGSEWFNVCALAWRRPGEERLTVARGAVNFEGITEFVCPAGPLELTIRAGGECRVVTEAQLAHNSIDNPLRVSVALGSSVELVFDERPSVAIGEKVDLFVINRKDLHLVRSRPPTEEIHALIANGESLRFLDPLLEQHPVVFPMASLRAEFEGLGPGSYTVLAFDELGHREDIRLEPTEIHIGPGHNRVPVVVTRSRGGEASGAGVRCRTPPGSFPARSATQQPMR